MEKQLQIVTFEQAKKLKELGSDFPTYALYKKDTGELIQEGKLSLLDLMFGLFISAPTIALALKWLRDEKNIFVYVLGKRRLEIKDESFKVLRDIRQNFNSYEEAESAGLDYALVYLLKEKNEN